MGIIKFYFHPIFIIFSFFMIYFGEMQIYCVYMLTLILHEMCHLIVAKLLGHRFSNIVFMPYGAGINAVGKYIPPKDEFLIAIAGPLGNILLVLLSISFWWINPLVYSKTYDFVVANISMALFNVLPVLPLDGGRAINSLFYKNSTKIKKISNITCIFLSIIMMIMFIYSWFINVNYTYLFITCFLISSLYLKDNEQYFLKANLLNSDIINPIKEKVLIVPCDFDDRKLLRYIKSDTFIIFKFLDENGNVIKVIDQNKLLKNLIKNTTKIL